MNKNIKVILFIVLSLIQLAIPVQIDIRQGICMKNGEVLNSN